MFIKVKDIAGEDLGVFKWNETEGKVVLSLDTENETHKKILQKILETDRFFDPVSDSFVNEDSVDFWDGFETKAIPLLAKYGYKYEIG